MKLRILSDAHFEFWVGSQPTNLEMKYALDSALPELPDDKNTVLILAGDISSKPSQRSVMIDILKARFREVIYVAGNHEHYGHELAKWDRERAVLPCETSENGKIRIMVLDRIRFLFTTLWAPYGLGKPMIELGLTGTSDVVCIKKSNVAAFQELHVLEASELQAALAICKAGPTAPTVVVTHYPPSFRLQHPDYPPSTADEMFMSNFMDLPNFDPKSVDLWIYGHNHYSRQVELDGVKTVSNQLGYVGIKEKTGYDPKLVIEV